MMRNVTIAAFVAVGFLLATGGYAQSPGWSVWSHQRLAEEGGGNGGQAPQFAEEGGGNGGQAPQFAEEGGGNGGQAPQFAEEGGGNGGQAPQFA